MRYVFVQDSQIVGNPGPLPRSWRNFSGLHLMSAELLASLGWLPYEIQDERTSPDQIEDGFRLDIGPTKVVKTRLWRDRTPEEMAQYLGEMNEENRRARQAAYTLEADPLFFKWQRGEITQQEWESKISEIRARYPYRVAP